MSDKDIIDKISIMEIKEGDVVVIESEKQLSASRKNAISEIITGKLRGADVLVLDGGLSMRIARKASDFNLDLRVDSDVGDLATTIGQTQTVC